MSKPLTDLFRARMVGAAPGWRGLVLSLLIVVVFASLFFVLQRLTFLLRFSPYERTTLWIPGALTFTALLILPYRFWWQIFLGLCMGAWAAYCNRSRPAENL